MPSEDALKQASRDVLRYHSRRVYGRPTMSKLKNLIVLALFTAAMVGVPLLKVIPVPSYALSFVYFVYLMVIMLLIGLTMGDSSPTRIEAARAALKYNRAIYLLTHCSAPEAVGPLIDVLRLPDITAYVPLALCKTLPHLQTEHSSLLNRKQRDSLMRLLTEPDPDSLDLQRSTVLALANIGDAQALPILEQLASGAWGAGESLELREDARSAFVAIQERIHPGYAGRDLLRASDAPAVSPDGLLRPTTSGAETPPEELLRARDAR